MFFVWQREIGALQFSCQFDMKVPDAKRGDVNDLLAMLNNRLWLGHFDLELQQNTPLFRYAILTRGGPHAGGRGAGGSGRDRAHRVRAFLSRLPVRHLGREEPVEAMAASMIEVAGEA